MSKRTPLIITLAAAALWPAAASADSPATPAERGNSTPITEARLDGSRLTVSLRCRRAATVTVAGTERRVACDGRGRARFRVRPEDRLRIAVRADGRSMTATLPFGGTPGAARAAAWQTWPFPDGNAACEHPNSVRIGISADASFGRPFGQRFSWRTWMYWVDPRDHSRYGFIPADRTYTGYAGMNGFSQFHQWTTSPGYWFRPLIEITAPGYGDWNFVRVNGAFPSPAYDANWCRY
jgi:hypothetical protein